MKILTTLLAFGLTSLVGLAQNETDVFRYSNSHFGGSARYNSLGGAMGAVGADFSSLSVNPAGMGRYRASDFSFSAGLNLTNGSSNFKGNSFSEGNEKLGFNQIGIVFTEKANADNPNKWAAVQFGFGYNRLNDFNRSYTIEGVNDRSFSERLAFQGEDIIEEELNTYSPFGAGVAYSAWLIDPLAGSGKTVYTTQMYVDSIFTNHKVREKGRQGEWVLGVSGNYNEKFYIGGSVGLTRIHFEQEKIHSETSLIDTTDIDAFTYTERLTTKGKGINAKIGAIYLPVKWLRIGLAYQTPTLHYNMRDTWSTEINTLFREVSGDRQIQNQASSPDGNFTYRMVTPAKITASAAIVIKAKGMISVDYELVDYSGGKLKTHPETNDTYNFETENETVVANHKQVGNIRVGAEYRLTNLFMLRGGFGYYQNGYNDSVVSQNIPKIAYSFGAGYRSKGFYVDLGLNMFKTSEDYYMYDPLLVANTKLDFSRTSISTTVGFKF
ncbi:MAG: hypothetical protein ACI8Q1_000762 [Parvicella sp.]|jgi:hypothetical protein